MPGVMRDAGAFAYPTAYEIALGYLRRNPRLTDILDLLGLTFDDYVRAIAARMPPETYTSACTASQPA
jgi:hypothetical protein